MGNFGAFLKVVWFFALGFMAALIMMLLLEDSLGLGSTATDGNSPIDIINAIVGVICGALVVRAAGRRSR